MVRVPQRYVPVIAREYVWRLVLAGAIEVDLSRVEALTEELARVLGKSLKRELARVVAARPVVGDVAPSELPVELPDLRIGLGDFVPLELSEELLDRPGIVLGDAAVLRIVEGTVSHLSTSGAVTSIQASDGSLCTTLRELLERPRQFAAERHGIVDSGPPPGRSPGGASPASAPVQLGRPDSVRKRPPEPDDEFDLR